MTDKDKKRKYLLFKKDDGRPDHLKPCAFFNSPEGCKNGSNCRFLHGNGNAAPSNSDSDASSVASDARAPSISDVEPAPTMNAIKKDHKKRRTNDPGDEAAYPLLRVPSAEEEISLLKNQMAHQQKLFEEQLKLLSNQISIQSIKSKSNDAFGNSALPGISLHGNQKASKKPLEKIISETESSDDEKFLFSTVNQILENGRTVDPNSASKSKAPKSDEKSKSAQSRKSSNSEPNPFLVQSNNAKSPAPVKAPAAANTNNNNNANNNSFGLFPGNTPFTNSFQPISGNLANPPGLLFPGTLPTTGSFSFNSGIPPQQQQAPSSMKKPTSTFQIETDTSANVPTPMKSPESTTKRKNVFAKTRQPSISGGNGLIPKLDFKTLDYKHLNWEELVGKTQSHSRYKVDYALNVDGSWVSARAGLKPEYPVIALDCEMCETEDPVTQVRESTLIRLSVVNGFNPEEVLIDTLVAPMDPVSDFRTRIHGITEEQLAGVKCTLRQVQAALLRMITDQTVIIGHSVYNDLKVLKLNHQKCVDTAYLFPVENESENSRPGLKLVAEQLLGLNVPEPHDSIMDSRVALYAAAFALEVGCLSIKRTAASFEQPSLLVHRIPEYVTEEHVKSMIMTHTNIIPSTLSPLVRGESNSANDPVGKITVYFVSQAHADLAFETIQGPIKPDKKNRPQKKVYLQGGGHVYVRK